MMKHHMMKTIGFATWFITAASAICVGLRVVGIRLGEMEFMMNHPMLQKLFAVIIGVSGVISMLMFVMMIVKGGCGCGCPGCSCGPNCVSCKSD